VSEKKEEVYANGAPATSSVPTNRHAAKRPYCKKHSRAMLDIGGEKKCPTCVQEELKAAQK
jgi:hypothetical protein